MIDKRKLVKTENDIKSDAKSFASHVSLAKVLKDYNLRRVISFHSRIAAAKDFSNRLPEVVDWMTSKSKPSGNIKTGFVAGNMPTYERNRNLSSLGEVKRNQRYILSNARCLSEGVDVPALDGIALLIQKILK